MSVSRPASVIAILAGVLLFSLSFFWPTLVGGKRVWSDQQAKDYADTLADLHRLSGQADQAKQMAKQAAEPKAASQLFVDSQLAESARTGAEIDPATATLERLDSELDRTKQRAKALRAQLDDARSYGSGTAVVIRWIGVLLAVAGVLGLAIPTNGDSAP